MSDAAELRTAVREAILNRAMRLEIDGIDGVVDEVVAMVARECADVARGANGIIAALEIERLLCGGRK